MTKHEISNTDDVIDSRDVMERIDELEGLGDDKSLTQEDLDELTALRALRDEAEDYAPDWKYGACLIRRSYFVDYCQELVSDIGDMPKEIPSYIAIDWQKTADNLEVDYTSVEFDGVEYLVR